jgi:hypothetical protein
MKPLYILIDGIDESLEAVEIAKTLLALERNSGHMRILLTCRPERQIEDALLRCSRIETTSDTFAPDRKRCLKWNLRFDEKLKDIEPEMKDKIMDKLLSREKRVYQLPSRFWSTHTNIVLLDFLCSNSI